MLEIKEFVEEKINELVYLKTNNTLTNWGKGGLDAFQKVLYQIELLEEQSTSEEKVISLESLSNSIDKYR